MTARTIGGKPSPKHIIVGMRREVSRVTTTGVYYVMGLSSDGTRKLTAPYAHTRFADSPNDEWHEDSDGNLVLITYYMGTEHARITYKLEGAEQ